ncbi:cold-shock protein [Brevundimonas sp. S30B]|jgi:cold shock protein|uniref:cold-shock protein n=1 Tax=unclassified Brevundimonas TaxID=2622653 RepID=UPI0010724562|nr:MULTISPECIES: cold-shock protein [unclassified Brevundimonas]QBX37881.1 cold-shock protein [Brevundimonas sp. MF30-B]TFW02763.1 cold-shock protein [Brevundimonas sp. S30B]
MPQGVVKFFNAAKGFGFIATEGGGPDVFVHISAVQAAGLIALNEGDAVGFELEADRRSGRSSAVDLTVTARASRPERPARPAPAPPRFPAARREKRGSGRGVVKWFDPTKGFGFIQPEGGGDDVFVHARSLNRTGLQELSEGQTVAYDLEEDGRTGKTAAVNVRLG